MSLRAGQNRLMSGDIQTPSPEKLPAPAVGVWTDVRPEPGETDGRRRYGELLDEVRLIDQLPYRTFCTTEQHGVDDGYLPAQLTMIAGLATITHRVRFLTNALILPLHPYRQVVEQALVADLLSGGRLALGVAAGGYAREFEIFDVEMKRRGAIMEERIPLLRQGLSDGTLPDGPGGSALPVLPPPHQEHLPIYLGGHAPKVIDRAARFADGVLPVDFFDPDVAFGKMWEETIAPAMSRHQRTLDDFRLTINVHLLASEDPERDFETFFRDALEYQFGKYTEWAGDRSKVGIESESDHPWVRERMLIDTPAEIARRLLAIREQLPFHEVVFWYRIPRIGHERALENLERVAKEVIPLLDRAAVPGERG